MNVDEIKSEIDGISPDTSKEDLIKKIDFFIKQLNLAHDMNRNNNLVMIEALEVAQTRYKKAEAKKEPLKMFIKKVLIGIGWYEASYDELKEIHEGRIGVSEKS